MWRVILPKKKPISITYISSFLPHEANRLNDFIATQASLISASATSMGEYKVHIESTLGIILPADDLRHIELECNTGNFTDRINVLINIISG